MLEDLVVPPAAADTDWECVLLPVHEVHGCAAALSSIRFLLGVLLLEAALLVAVHCYPLLLRRTRWRGSSQSVQALCAGSLCRLSVQTLGGSFALGLAHFKMGRVCTVSSGRSCSCTGTLPLMGSKTAMTWPAEGEQCKAVVDYLEQEGDTELFGGCPCTPLMRDGPGHVHVADHHTMGKCLVANKGIRAGDWIGAARCSVTHLEPGHSTTAARYEMEYR